MVMQALATATRAVQFRDPVYGLHSFMITLVVAEIAGWLVLVAGFLDGQIF
jgi:hypothetical protein